MAADSSEIVTRLEGLRADFQGFSSMVTGGGAMTATAADMELRASFITWST